MKALAVALLALALGGCLYSFTGGGLPSHIRTIAVTTFENNTAQPLLESDLQTALQNELPRNLGVRLAAASVADAVVRGKITGYEEVAASVRPSDQPGQIGGAAPGAHQLRRGDLRREGGQAALARPVAVGPGQLPARARGPRSIGRARAIKELVNKLIEGAQSQW